MMAENQAKLVEGMNKLLTKLDEKPTQPTITDSRQTRQQAPHLSTTSRQKQSYEPSSPSEGAYARDLNRSQIHLKEPKIKENLRFTGESKTLRIFLLDIYHTLERFASEFADDKRRINWIADHFASNNNDVSPSQAWFLALLMKNAHVHGVIDPYANLMSLEYVLPPLCSTHAFIRELISVFGDKTSSRTARQDLARCKQGNLLTADYNSRYTALALYVVQSEEDAVLKYVAGLNQEI